MTQEALDREIETGPVNDTFFINLRGPMRQGPDVLRRVQQAMADLPGVEVELHRPLND